MEHGFIGEVASLRKLFPTVGYYAYDGRKLIEPIRASDYKGITKPWAYLSVALLAYTLLKRAAPTVEDIVPDLDLKIDAVFFFLAPYCYSLWHVSSEDAGTPATYPQCVSLVLYILGSLVLVVAAGELQYALSGTAYRGVSTWITYAFIVRTFYLVWLFLGSSAKVTLATMLFVVHLVGFIVLIPLFGLVGTSPGTLIAHVLGDEKAIKWWAPRDDKERYLIELARRKTVAP